MKFATDLNTIWFAQGILNLSYLLYINLIFSELARDYKEIKNLTKIIHRNIQGGSSKILHLYLQLFW